jgi:GNAT superfamily N-acetyltransferase
LPSEDYVEAGRSWWSLAGLGALVVVGVVLDGIGGGLADHWVGWLVAAVLLLGIDALVIHAGRVHKTLRVTSDELRVGDEVIERAAVVGASVEPPSDLPVLGWPAGAPRRLAGVTVRLDDGRSAVIPTRRPEAVLALLGPGTAAEPVELREADEDDEAVLADVDERASTLFRIAGLSVPAVDGRPPGGRPRQIYVAGRPVVGFAAVGELDGEAWLAGVAVVPGSMRQGLGGRLIEQACAWARSAGYGAIVLTTYADVAWNGPMYARHGWVELPDPAPELAAVRAWEVANGLDGAGRRIAMRRPL